MSTTSTAKVVVDTSQAQQALAQLQDKVKGTSKVFGELKSAIAGLAVGTFLASAYAMANAITDMGKATGISTQALLGFRAAVAANGGDAEKAVDGIGKFAQAIDSAAQGSKELQDRFLAVGVSLNDLRKLSEEELLSKVIDGLGKVNDNAKRTAIGVDFFGKSFRSVDFVGIASGIDKFNTAAAGSAAGIDSAGQASQNFKDAFITLQTETLKALKPISDLAVGLTESAEKVGKFIRIALEIGAVVAAFTLVGKALWLIRAAITIVAEAWTSLLVGARIAINLFKGFSKIIENLGLLSFGSALRVLGTIFVEFGKALATAVPGLVAFGVTIGIVWGHIKEFFGLNKDAAADDAKVWADWDKATEEYMRNRAENADKTARLVQDAMTKEQLALSKSLRAYKDAAAESQKRYLLETEGINATLRTRSVLEQRQETDQRYYSEMARLTDQLTEKKKLAAAGSESEAAMIPLIEKALAELYVEYQKQISVSEKLVDDRQNELNIEQQLNFERKNRIDTENTIKRIQDEIAMLTMPTLIKQQHELTAAAEATAKAQIEAEEARRNIAPGTLPQDDRDKITAAAFAGLNKLKTANKELYEQSRTFETGWKQAFNAYVEDATNAAMQAKTIFNGMASAFESVFEQMVRTGKVNWRQLLEDMTLMFIKSDIQNLFASLVNGKSVGGGGGNLFATIGKFFGGFAAGGTIPAGGFGLTGERGPELVSGPATITPLDKIGGATQVTYNINAIDARSFQQLLATQPELIYALTLKGQRGLPGGR